MSSYEPLPALSTRTTRLLVAHSFPVWLPTTQNWMQTVVDSLPSSIESHVVCARAEGARGAANIHVSGRSLVARILPRGHGLWHRRFLAGRLRALRASVLHSHFGDVGWQDRIAARAAHVRHVVSFYGYDAGALPRRPGWGDRLRELFESASVILVQGPRFAERLRALGCPERALRVVPLGLVLERFPFAPNAWDGRSPLRILIAGSFREKKGIPDALRAAALVREHLPVEITLIGAAPPDAAGRAEEERIEAAIDELALAPYLRQMGAVAHGAFVAEARRHDVFVCASRTADDGDTEGGLPVTLLEMAALGLPIVATRHADIPELVEHDRTGRLVAEGDVAGLGREILWVAGNPDERRSIAARARRRVEERFDARVHGRALAGLYAG